MDDFIINSVRFIEGEAVKSFFGLSYDQMQHKNATNFNEYLKIAHITKKGNIKYNMNETNIFKGLVSSACNKFNLKNF